MKVKNAIQVISIFNVILIMPTTVAVGLASTATIRGGPVISRTLSSCSGEELGLAVTAADKITNKPSPPPPASSSQLVNAISLVAGTTVGAGILALPAVAAEAGFVPSTVALLGSWVFMATTGLLIAEVCCNLVKADKANENIGILSMAKKTLGPYGAAGAGAVYLFIHYALLVAYIAEAGGILSDTAHMPQWTGPVAFTSIIGGTLAFGNENIISAVNNFFVVIVVVAFSGLVAMGLPSVNFSNLLRSDTSAVLQTIPVMFVALVYHNVVPVICAQLQYNVQQIRIAITAGSLIPLAMFITWNLVILGIATPGSAADPVQLLRSGGAGEITGALVSLFSEAAIITSFIGFVIGLIDFFTDVFPDRSKKDLLLFGATLLPPLVVAILDPDIFRGALDYAGTFGISVLFGAIPAIMAFKMRSNVVVEGRESEPLLRLEKKVEISYDLLVPGGPVVLYLVLLGTAVVIGQKLLATLISIV